ncbi:RagB/SusD family nutrient uptake outer membrane protein [Bacteroides sp. AN502(2024)]|uniref:RagB/SusD family nutrient uptake outer membrane protein n=1 Tax=Bacteroides sp. AN502(2024) TaxID=3160599 RepID=UPI0035183002
MKLNKLFITAAMSSCLLLSSCSSFLDQVPDDVVSLEAVFSTKKDVERYLNTVYSYIPQEQNPKNGGGPVCDEMDFPWPEYEENYINNDAMTPAKSWRQSWGKYYRAIRQASTFISHVDACNDFNLTADLKRQYKAEARFLRAYYYFNLMRWYGPLVIMPETEINMDAPLKETSIPRSTVDETVQYIYDQLEQACEERLMDWYYSNLDYGHATQAAARALQARVLLYAASPLYNGNADYAKYSYFQTPNGTPLINPTYSAEKWTKARNATKRFVEEYGSRFGLYKSDDNLNNDPMIDYQYQFLETDWSKNKEIIFARTNCGFWDFEANGPRFVNGWAGYAPTQNVVDDFYTENGLPIRNTAWADKDAAYPENDETGEACATPTRYALAGTSLMYANREPRFYASICYDNSRWLAPNSTPEDKRTICQFYKGGNTGLSTSRNKSTTGYIMRKFSNPTVNWKNSQSVGNRHMAIIRMAEIYLNYAEAENECDDRNIETVLHYVNLVRERAGLPGWSVSQKNGYNMLKSSSKEAVRLMIQRERRIELAFENHRFFDERRWKIFQEVEKDGIWGMDINQVRPSFYTRVQTEPRPSAFKYYLWPIPQDEFYKNKNIIQNPEWESEK